MRRIPMYVIYDSAKAAKKQDPKKVLRISYPKKEVESELRYTIKARKETRKTTTRKIPMPVMKLASNKMRKFFRVD